VLWDRPPTKSPYIKVSSRSHPILFPVIKFGVRQATAFVGHSFLPKDEEIVGKLTEYFSKLGVDCDSGKKAEAVGISPCLG
jgi:hypothetical protein